MQTCFQACRATSRPFLLRPYKSSGLFGTPSTFMTVACVANADTEAQCEQKLSMYVSCESPGGIQSKPCGFIKKMHSEWLRQTMEDKRQGYLTKGKFDVAKCTACCQQLPNYQQEHATNTVNTTKSCYWKPLAQHPRSASHLSRITQPCPALQGIADTQLHTADAGSLFAHLSSA